MKRLIFLLLLVGCFLSAIAQENQDEGPITVVTKDNKQYYQVRYQFRDNGLLLLNSEGMTVVPYDQLPEDLSEFPKNEQEFIRSKQTPLPQAPVDESLVSFTTKSGLAMNNASFSLSQSGIVVHTRSSGDVTLAYDQIDLTSLRTDVQLKVAKIRQTMAEAHKGLPDANASTALPGKITVTADVVPTNLQTSVPIDSHMDVEAVTVKAGVVLTPIGIKDNYYIIPVLISISQRVADQLHTGTQKDSMLYVPAISTGDLQNHSHMVDITQKVEGTGLIPINQTKVTTETSPPEIAPNSSEPSTAADTNMPSSATPVQAQPNATDSTTQASSADTSQPEVQKLYPSLERFQESGLWGYRDKNNKEILAPQFLYAGEFKEGVAKVWTTVSFGYVDTNGHIVPTPKESDESEVERQIAAAKICFGMSNDEIESEVNQFQSMNMGAFGRFGSMSRAEALRTILTGAEAMHYPLTADSIIAGRSSLAVNESPTPKTAQSQQDTSLEVSTLPTMTANPESKSSVAAKMLKFIVVSTGLIAIPYLVIKLTPLAVKEGHLMFGSSIRYLPWPKVFSLVTLLMATFSLSVYLGMCIERFASARINTAETHLHYLLNEQDEPYYLSLHSEVNWISLNRVITALKTSGFKQVMNNPELLEFRKQMKSNDPLHAVAVGISLSPSSKSIWCYRVARISTKETMDFDNQSFADANTAICGLFVSEKEWNDIAEFINTPLSQVGVDQPISNSMIFQNSFLKTECELVTEKDGTKELSQSFLVSSKE